MVAYISRQLNVLLIFRLENEQYVHSTFSVFIWTSWTFLKKNKKQKQKTAVCQKKHNQLMVWKSNLSCPSVQQTL